MITWVRGLIRFPQMKKEMSLVEVSVKNLRSPREIFVPLWMRSGEALEVIVQVGDQVKIGTPVGRPLSSQGAFAHASVAGKVISITDQIEGKTLPGKVVQIKNDDSGEKELMLPLGLERDRQKVCDFFQRAGLVAMDGTGLPVHEFLKPKSGKKIKTIILNGIEEEPYLTADYLTMLEFSSELVRAARWLKELLMVDQVILAVGKSKVIATELVKSRLFSEGNAFIKTHVLADRYPQGDRRKLLKTITGQRLTPGREAHEEGALILSVATAVAIADAVFLGQPLVERVVTVTGECLADPHNLRVPIGALYQDLVKASKGVLREPAVWIVGGPMSGFATPHLSFPVEKHARALIALPPEESLSVRPEPCIQCGLCVDYCPEDLHPALITTLLEEGNSKPLTQLGAGYCSECGNCQYVCPSHRPMLSLMQLAKKECLSYGA